MKSLNSMKELWKNSNSIKFNIVFNWQVSFVIFHFSPMCWEAVSNVSHRLVHSHQVQNWDHFWQVKHCKGLTTPCKSESERDALLGWNTLICKGLPTPSKSGFRSNGSESHQKAMSFSHLLSLVWVTLKMGFLQDYVQQRCLVSEV